MGKNLEGIFNSYQDKSALLNENSMVTDGKELLQSFIKTDLHNCQHKDEEGKDRQPSVFLIILGENCSHRNKTYSHGHMGY